VGSTPCIVLMVGELSSAAISCFCAKKLYRIEFIA